MTTPKAVPADTPFVLVPRKNGYLHHFWTAEQTDAAELKYGGGDIDCCIQNMGRYIDQLERELVAAKEGGGK